MKNTQSWSPAHRVFSKPIHACLGNALLIFALMVLSGWTVRADVIYRETFGNTDPNSRQTPNLYGWQGWDQTGAFFNTTGSGFGIDNAVTGGSPTNVANVNAGGNADGSTNALFGSRFFWNGAHRMGWTPEFPVDPTLYQPGSIVFSFYLGNANAADQVRIVIRQGGQWYYSTASFASPATLTGDFQSNAVYSALTYSPTASTWQILNFDGGYNGGGLTNGLAAAATNSTVALSGGGTATSDLTGPITAFGILGMGAVPFANPAGNIRFDTFEVDATPIPLQPPKVITWQGAVDTNWDLATFNWLTNGVATNFATGDFVLFDDTGLATGINLATPVLPGSVSVNATANYTFSGNGITGSGSLTKSGSGTLTLLNNNSYSGVTLVSAGTVQVGNGGGAGSLGGGAITNQGVIIFNRSNSVTAGAIAGTGSLRQNGTGSLTLSGPNLYSGATIVNAGTLVASSGLPSTSLLTNAPGSTIVIASTNGGATFINGSLLPGNAATAGTFVAANGMTLGSTA
ncbi:MAG TPA: autotransporter-associated beta strand repeat-containing protein, partial [Desulfuromonadaceae bacterium]|nr:autotransporter-associated beta strand repeat-containing protein [Desulfuromonadaceae bacterium]